MSEGAVNTGVSPKPVLKRRGLGRGLGALIPEGVSMAPPAAERRVHVSEIRPNPRQPRRYFDEQRIAELADSIRQQLSLIHISEPTRRTPISYAVFCLKNFGGNGAWNLSLIHI